MTKFSVSILPALVGAAIAFSVMSATTATPANAVVLNAGDSVRVDYVPGALGPGIPPFFQTFFGLNFSSANPFGPNDTLDISLFGLDNLLIGHGSIAIGAVGSSFTSGANALTISIGFPVPLTTTSFYAIVTDDVGFFDLISGQADLFTIGNIGNELGTVGTLASSVPEPSTWAMMILGFFAIGARTYRRRKSTALNAV